MSRKPIYPFTAELAGVVGATPDEIGMMLWGYAAAVPVGQEIVELGVYQGRTALIMAHGAARGRGAHVTGIDAWDMDGNTYDAPFTDSATMTQAIQNVQHLGYRHRVALVREFSAKAAEFWGRKPIGLLFVDGDHSAEGCRRDIEAWAPHLADERAIIAVDDYGHPDWPGVAEAVDGLVTEGFLTPVQIFHERLVVTRLVHRQGGPV